MAHGFVQFFRGKGAVTDQPPRAGHGDPREVLGEHYHYSLFHLGENRYVLEITVHQGPGGYSIHHELSADEVGEYQRRGKRYIKALARRLRAGHLETLPMGDGDAPG